MIRADKTTPNADAARTLILGIIAAILIIFGTDPAVILWERYGASRPWVDPIIEVIPSRDGKPDILYKAVVRFPVSGYWTAYLQAENGKRSCVGKGRGDYKPNNTPARLWSWADWMGSDCAEPLLPYQACASYKVQSDRGVWDTTDPVCSTPYDPRKTK